MALLYPPTTTESTSLIYGHDDPDFDRTLGITEFVLAREMLGELKKIYQDRIDEANYEPLKGYWRVCEGQVARLLDRLGEIQPAYKLTAVQE